MNEILTSGVNVHIHLIFYKNGVILLTILDYLTIYIDKKCEIFIFLQEI